MPGILAGESCGDGPDFNACMGFNHPGPCVASGEFQMECTSKGKTYYKCECESNTIAKADIDSGLYTCAKSFNTYCGCSRKDARCNSGRYPEHGCAGKNSYGLDEDLPNGQYCKDPNDGSKWFKECLCDSGYTYTCQETGLAKPTTTDYFELPGGKFYYKNCNCANGWLLEVSCSDRVDGCTTEVEKVFSGTGYCYHCTNEQCADSHETNLEVLWCSEAQRVITNCDELGYTKTNNGKCPNGAEGIACPFDKSYIFCQ